MIFSVLPANASACGIYKITNSINAKIYVGSSLSVKKRYAIHQRELLQNKHHCAPLQSFANKYGVDKLTFTLLEVCTRENLLEREQYYLDSLEAHYSAGGFNISPTAGSPLGVKRSPEHIEAMRARSKGNTNRRGASQTPEARAKMSASKKGKMTSQAHIEAMRQANLTNRVYATGYKLNAESIAKREATRAARRAELGPTYGAKPEDYKRRKSEQMKAKHQAKLAAMGQLTTGV